MREHTLFLVALPPCVKSCLKSCLALEEGLAWLLTLPVLHAGALFIWSSQRYLEQFEDVKFETLRGANARKVLLVVGIMTAHALGEGSGVGVSFCGKRGWSQVRFGCLKTRVVLQWL